MLGCIPQAVRDRRQLEPDVEDALWWRESMKLLGQLNFMEVLLTFDKNSIPADVIKQVITALRYLPALPASPPRMEVSSCTTLAHSCLAPSLAISVRRDLIAGVFMFFLPGGLFHLSARVQCPGHSQGFQGCHLPLPLGAGH